MKQTIQFALAIAASAAAMFAYMYEAPPEKVVQEVAQEATRLSERAGLPEKLQEANLSKLLAIFNSMGGREYNTVEYWDEKENSLRAAERSQFDRVNVEPWNPSYTRCYEEAESNDGTLQCETTWEYPRHHYYSATTKELLELSYSDALAAAISAKRVVKYDPSLAFKLRMQAVALSNKASPLIDAAYSLNPQLDPTSKPVESDYAFFALINVAMEMGYAHNDSEYTPTYFSLDQEKLNSATTKLKVDLAKLQSTVSGSTNLKELFDV